MQSFGKYFSTTIQAVFCVVGAEATVTNIIVQFLSDSDKAESPGGFSSWEYKDENGAWIEKINWERIGTRNTEEYKRSACEECKVWLEDFMCNICSDLKWQFLCWDQLLGDD
jgi:hypothetical protein